MPNGNRDPHTGAARLLFCDTCKRFDRYMVVNYNEGMRHAGTLSLSGSELGARVAGVTPGGGLLRMLAGIWITSDC